MRTRAVAVGSEHSNAIGAVELECTPGGLLVVYHGVGAFQAGYAPGAVTHGTRVLVPWAGVSEARVEADRLFVAVDEALTPHNRMMLAGFSSGDPPDPRELRRRRWVIRVGTIATMAAGGLLVAVTVARISSDTGAASAVLFGCFAAAIVFLVGMVAEQRLELGGIESDGVRLAFATELSRFVPGLAPTLSPAAVTKAAPPPAPIEWPSFQALLPRTTTAVVITMSAALFGAVLTAAWVSRAPARAAANAEAPEPERESPEEASESPPAHHETASGTASPATTWVPASALPAAAAPAPPAAAGDVAPLSGVCRCGRADSQLWHDGIPRMSVVLIDRKQRQHKGHPHLDLEIGVVNNWEQPIPEVRLLVQFYERDPPPSKKRTATYDRPLYFEGPLEPGQAIKWHADARGDDFEVTGPPATMLDETGTDAAAANLFAELLRANHRPIRLHGAMMLSYLGDPRAREGALALREALREDEAPYIDRLSWTLSEVRTCAIDVKPGASPRATRVCVFNATKEVRDHLAVRMRALDRPFRYDTPIEAPPLVLAEHGYHLDGPLRPGEGAFASFLFPTDNPDGLTPQAFEATADAENVVF